MFGCKFHNQSNFGIDYLWCWKRVFAMTSMFSWQNSVIFCPAAFCTPSPNLPGIPGISQLPPVAFQSPMMKMTSFFLVLVLEDVVGLYRTGQLQLLWHQWLRHRLGLLWYWMVCLGKKPRSLCCFWGCPKYDILGFFVVYEDYSIFSKGFLPVIVDVTVIWIKFAHSHPF